jgi:3-isopropylmalate dehydrogenase
MITQGHPNPPTSTIRWSDCIFPPRVPAPGKPFVIGVLEGEGTGPEVVSAALQVLAALEAGGRQRFAVQRGGAIGRPAERTCGAALSPAVIDFCAGIFAQGGAVLAGAGGGRFVYDLRKRFDLFCKFSPLCPADELLGAGPLKAEYRRGIDIVIVRENASGLYQGTWRETRSDSAGRTAEHCFSYSEAEVRRILRVATGIAQQRRGEVLAIYKESGAPTISALWRDCAREEAAATGVHYTLADVDYAAYRLVRDARDIDVVVAPNLCGDILSDLGGVLLGSRGLTFSGNFAADGAAVYQTNHGAAYDLAGTDRVNPVGQIQALAMLLRESFGLCHEAHVIESGIARVWRDGWRTADLAEPGCRVIGTRAITDLIAAAVAGQGTNGRQIPGRP